MKRRDLKDGMRVAFCIYPWAIRYIRKPNLTGIPGEKRWLLYAGVLSCTESIVCRPRECWKYVDGEPFQVEKSPCVLIKCKRFILVPVGRKQVTRETWSLTVVKPIEILCTWEDFLPIKKKVAREMRKFEKNR